MKKRILIPLLSLIILAAFSFTASALDIRVLLGNNTDKASVMVARGQYIIFDDSLNATLGVVQLNGNINYSIEGGMIKLNVNGADMPIRSKSVSLFPVSSECLLQYNSLLYRDGISVKYFDDTNLNVINKVEMEHYLYGVVGREMGYSAPVEAFKAQAVISRTYAYANMNASKRYDVSATTSSQVYGGYNEEKKPNFDDILQAISETTGLVMLYNNAPFPAYFCANAGGHTESAGFVWGGSSSVPFTGVPSPYDDNGNSSYHWIVEYSKDDIVARANSYGNTDIGTLKDIVVTRTDAYGKPSVSGRAYRVDIIGTLGTVSASTDKIRSLLGLKSTLFELKFSGTLEKIHLKGLGTNADTTESKGLYAMDATKNTFAIGNGGITVIGADGTRVIGSTGISDISIEGYGHGHGVGLSQDGAIGMAKAGYTYQQILEHYYFSNANFSIGNMYYHK